jgi:hypothetical protein
MGGQHAAQDHAEQRAAEDAGEHERGDEERAHGRPDLASIGLMMLLAAAGSFMRWRSPGGQLPHVHIFGLHNAPASFDKLRIRENCVGTKKAPHPELVEGRTPLIPFSCTSLMRRTCLRA